MADRSGSRLNLTRLAANAALYDPPIVPTPEDELLGRDDRAILMRAVDGLRPRVARLLRLHHGIDCEAQTLTQIGAQYGVSAERIRQMEGQGFRELKRRGGPLLQLAGKYTDRWHRAAARNLYRPEVDRVVEPVAKPLAEPKPDLAAAIMARYERMSKAERQAQALAAAQATQAAAGLAAYQIDADAQRRFHEFAARCYAVCGMSYPPPPPRDSHG